MPGALQHIFVRGMERKKIFRSDYDRQNLVGRLASLIPDTNTECFAWVLMPNHFHLLLRTGSSSISDLMQRLLTGYAGWFNKKYKHHGPLFQNRYKSFLCQENPYLLELVRYIHLNPLRAGLVSGMEELDEFPWSGHSALMNNSMHAWQNIHYICGLFSNKRIEARKMYRAFVEKGLSDGRLSHLTTGGLIRSDTGWTALKKFRKKGLRIKSDERILGDSDFVTSVLKAANEKLEQKYYLKVSGHNFDWVVNRVAQIFSMAPSEVTAYDKAPRTVRARALLCFWAHRKLGMTTVDISKKLNICQPTVSRLSRKGEKLAAMEGLDLMDH